MKFKDIPQFPFSAYRVDVSWKQLSNHIDRLREASGIILQPSFQRGLVWNQKQKIAYCEYQLQGGQSGKEVFFNCPSWMGSFSDPLECVDGQQRIQAILDFLNNKIPVFDTFYQQFEDTLPYNVNLSFNVTRIKDRKELLKWYISLNKGGSYHTETDLAPAYQELKELGK